jgi:hypothetical protein
VGVVRRQLGDNPLQIDYLNNSSIYLEKQIHIFSHKINHLKNLTDRYRKTLLNVFFQIPNRESTEFYLQEKKKLRNFYILMRRMLSLHDWKRIREAGRF